MHELSLVESLIETLVAESHKQHFRRVRTVELEVGELSCVEPEALEFAFLACSKGTLAEGASLRITRKKGRAYCELCALESDIETAYDPCPACGAVGLEIRTGRALEIVSLEVE